jgi:protein involved in polysaccharide export with SLBB domain
MIGHINYRFSVIHFGMLLLFTFSINVYGQSPENISRLLGVDNLSEIRIDDLSDFQLQELIKKGNSRGYNDSEIFNLLGVSGLSQLELSKLRLRYSDIQNKNIATINTGQQQEQLLRKTIIPDQQIDVLTTQKNINDSTDNTFGKSIFKNGNINFFEKTVDRTAPENYTLGVGDVISVNIWGVSDFNGSYTIQKWGGISDADIDRIYLRGVTFEHAKSLLLSRFGDVYDTRSSSYEITLSYSREIDVSIVGEVERPGTYKIPAVNSLFNSLTVCGGPSKSGTLRDIVVLRDGKKIHTLDIYDYLMSPINQQDFYLENGDIIYVPVSKNIVDIRGELKRPGKYELLAGEGINKILELAGGYTSDAFLKNVQIKRYIDNQYLVFMDVDLDSIITNDLDLKLYDGDAIEIEKIDQNITSYIDITGSVNIPSRYEFIEGESVSDLIKRANGLKQNAYTHLAYIVRTNGLKKEYIKISLNDSTFVGKDEFKLANKDLIRIFALDEFEDSYQLEVFGLVRDPQALIYSPSMTLYDAIVLSGGLQYYADSRIEISRLDRLSGKAEAASIFVNVGVENNNIINNEVSQIRLEPFDRVFVRKKPYLITNDVVTLSGEVKYPGQYALNKEDEKISDLIERAGGLTSVAQESAAVFYREANGLGNIVLKLDNALKLKESTYNYILKGGDVISVPKIEYFVSIKGAIDYPIDSSSNINAPWIPNKSAKFYINKYANGFADSASRKRTYVLQANREVSRTSRTLFVKHYPKVRPGGVIYALNKIQKDKKIKNGTPINWNQLTRDVLTTATATVPLIILLLRN